MEREDQAQGGSLSAHRLGRRRILFFTLIIVWSGWATLLFADFLWRTGLYGWKYVLLGLFFLLFTYLTFGCMNAVFGFLTVLKRDAGGRITSLKAYDPSIPLASTAIIIPVYNEEPKRVFAGIGALYKTLQQSGDLGAFDIFILSDSTDPDRWVEEEMRWVGLIQDFGASGKIHYRHRPKNIDKKSGNVADFCRTWGGRFRYMIVFDADSIMTARTLVRMVRLMEQHPQVGILQTAPRLVRAETLYTRLQQFAVSLYGPVFQEGINYWQQGEGNYWGHNAIIRMEPFLEHCELPLLPGREPLGGKILSHDFVEAALMRRGGYEVWLAHDLEESYEEGPPDLVEAAKRDRRWCQGNLQHSWLLFSGELTLINRFHFLNGILSYGASFLWALFLISSTLVVFQHERSGLSLIAVEGFFAPLNPSLFEHGLIILSLTLFTLFLPKVMAIARALRLGHVREGHGGGFRLFGSCLIETLFSALYAPVLMLYHSQFILTTFFGKGVSWGPQKRDSGDGMSLWEAFSNHWHHTLVGLGWGALAFHLNPAFFWSLVPVLVGMVLIAPLSQLLSKKRMGEAFARWKLLSIPEETHPPTEVADIPAREAILAQRTPLPCGSGLMSAVVDPYVNAVHVSLLADQVGGELSTAGRELGEKLLRDGEKALSKAEMSRILNKGDLLNWLHREVWLRPFRNLHPSFKEAITRQHPCP